MLSLKIFRLTWKFSSNKYIKTLSEYYAVCFWLGSAGTSFISAVFVISFVIKYI